MAKINIRIKVTRMLKKINKRFVAGYEDIAMMIS